MFPVLSLLALTATAAPKVAIVDVDAPDLMMGLGAQVTKALVAEATAQKLDLTTPEQLRGKLDAKRYEALRKCEGKPACAAQELEALGLDRVVLGKLGRDEKNYLLKLWLIDLKGLTVLADVDRPILIAARRFQKDVEQAVPPLLRGEREARGTLAIEGNLADAQVFVNGEFIGTPPVSLSLRPGKYEVKLERKKYLGITRLLAVEANQTTTERFKLLLKPGELPDDQVMPALTKKDQPAAPAPGVQLSALTWIAGGLALAAGGTALGFGISARSQQRALLDGYDADTQVYQGTRAQALQQNETALIANVAFATAGVAAAATIVSLVVDVVRTPAVQVTPAPTPGGAALVLGGRF